MDRPFQNLFFALIALLGLAQSAYGAPALPEAFVLHQPDGTTFSARQWGDESNHGWETIEGYTIVKNSETKFWSFARLDTVSNQLIPDKAVGGQTVKGAGPAKYIRPNTTKGTKSFSATAGSIKTVTGDDGDATVHGTRPLPVMMVNFNDTEAEFQPADFDDLLFGRTKKTLRAYYEEVSYGAFSVTAGNAGVTGWYEAAYGHGYYGENAPGGRDARPAELVLETVKAADESIDFSEYDSDGDCYVDVVVIIHQGAGEESGAGDSDIWSHQWNLQSAEYYGDGDGVYTTNDAAACGNIMINNYIILPETFQGDMMTVGIFAHEYGHTLGLPDLYDVDGSSSGIGNWGLMGGGMWNKVTRYGDSPAHMSAWSKQQLGWVEPVVVGDGPERVTIAPASSQADVYQLFPADGDGREYFLVENRQRSGFDAGLPGSGLAIWHIDEHVLDGRRSANHANSMECAPSLDCGDEHYLVSLIQADGDWDLEWGANWGDDGDLYPGRYDKTALNRSSAPDSLLYDGSSSRVSVTDISEAQSLITATMAYVCTILPKATAGGSISPANGTAIAPGETITMMMAPKYGYSLSNVVVDGASVGAVSEYTFSNVQADHEIHAEFTAESWYAPPSDETSSDGAGSANGGCFISNLF